MTKKWRVQRLRAHRHLICDLFGYIEIVHRQDLEVYRLYSLDISCLTQSGDDLGSNLIRRTVVSSGHSMTTRPLAVPDGAYHVARKQAPWSLS